MEFSAMQIHHKKSDSGFVSSFSAVPTDYGIKSKAAA